MTADPCPRLRRGLYLVTPDTGDSPGLLARTAAALPHAALLQYRNKSAPPSLRRHQAAALRSLAATLGVAFIVNDDPDLALELDADGVHLGGHDASIRVARARLGPGAIVGASCYDDIDRAAQAADAGASYLAFGAFFATATKPGARRATPELLSEAARFGLPRVAIGGITPDNAAPLIAAGADLLAVVTGVYEAPDPGAAARRIAELFNGPNA